MEFSTLVFDRYSVRKYSDAAVSEEDVQTILRAALQAPTALNKQPWRIMVLNTPDQMAKLKECTKYSFGAPMALVVCAKPDEAWVRKFDGFNAAIIDAAVVGSHIMLTAHNLGLGACWVGDFDPAAFRTRFSLADDLEPVAIFPLGHPGEGCKPSLLHGKRRSLKEMVL